MNENFSDLFENQLFHMDVALNGMLFPVIGGFVKADLLMDILIYVLDWRCFFERGSPDESSKAYLLNGACRPADFGGQKRMMRLEGAVTWIYLEKNILRGSFGLRSSRLSAGVAWAITGLFWMVHFLTHRFWAANAWWWRAVIE